MFDGTPLKGRWRPLKMEVVDPDDGCEDSDFPRWFGGVLVFSMRALALMADCLDEKEVEILPIRTMPNRHGFDYDYSVVNVTNVVDCLDQQRSRIVRYRSSGRIMRIERYSFDTEALEGVRIFKIPEQSTTAVFVTSTFVQSYRSFDLEGLAFELVYSDVPKRRWAFWSR